MKKLLLILTILTFTLVKSTAQKEVQGIVRQAQVECYIEEILPCAIECAQTYDLPLECILAVSILESGYGTSELCKTKNNHLGLKKGKGWSRFRSIRTCYLFFGKLLTTRKRYENLKDCKDYTQFCYWLQWSGYCSSEGYGRKLVWLIEFWDLTNYNKLLYV